jgi:hypothetical protein
MPGDLVAHGSEEGAAQRPVPSRAQHDEVGADVLGFFQELMPGPADQDRFLHHFEAGGARLGRGASGDEAALLDLLLLEALGVRGVAQERAGGVGTANIQGWLTTVATSIVHRSRSRTSAAEPMLERAPSEPSAPTRTRPVPLGARCVTTTEQGA